MTLKIPSNLAIILGAFFVIGGMLVVVKQRAGKYDHIITGGQAELFGVLVIALGLALIFLLGRRK